MSLRFTCDSEVNASESQVNLKYVSTEDFQIFLTLNAKGVFMFNSGR